MNIPSEDLFPGPAFTQKHDSRIAACYFLRQLSNVVHLGTLAYDQTIALLHFLREELDFSLESLPLQRLLHDKRDMVRLERSRDEIVSSLFHRLDRPIDRPVCRYHNDRNVIVPLPKFFQNFKAAQAGHHVVEDNKIGS